VGIDWSLGNFLLVIRVEEVSRDGRGPIFAFPLSEFVGRNLYKITEDVVNIMVISIRGRKYSRTN
jgi:hypothetical protein